MKRVNAVLLLACCVSSVQGAFEYADRVIGNGEYVYGLNWLGGVLVVDGGGGDVIEVRNSSRVEVWSTSVPLGLDVGGIMDLVLKNYSRLDYYGGETEELTIRNNSEAYLYGGRIDFITSMQFVTWVDGEPTGQHIFIHARDGWEWKYENGVIRGITGLWLDDGTMFDIRLINHRDFDPAWANIKVIPEPATLLLMGLGTFLVHRRRCRLC